ncbi:hypothetical protein C5G87_11855 [Paenibacillus peoriae]|uniref:DUF4303 domain-containing protein n=1 Tax=Paenibacillus peoriae TaxID=59893 RepID=UPI000CEBC6E3|nr:DUF4303 domain-containing protein [Paenibacillus peoriae]PPQ48531.1 hypothetical protein C5G87_11855 [Paenibacillus peoriae]
MNNFLNEFEERFRAGFLDDLKSILEEVKNEKVYSCAFGTDSDFVTLFLAVNTEESLAKHIINMKAQGLCNSKEDENYYRWGFCEYQYGDTTHLNHISKFLYATENVFDYKDKMIKIMSKVVKETDDVLFNQFGQSKEDIIFFVSMTDDDMAEELENQSVIQMTNAKLVDDFLHRYQ